MLVHGQTMGRTTFSQGSGAQPERSGSAVTGGNRRKSPWRSLSLMTSTRTQLPGVLPRRPQVRAFGRVSKARAGSISFAAARRAGPCSTPMPSIASMGSTRASPSPPCRPLDRVETDQVVATVKIIPFAVTEAKLQRAEAAAQDVSGLIRPLSDPGMWPWSRPPCPA